MAWIGLGSATANSVHEVVNGFMNGGRGGVFLDRDGVINRSLFRDGKPYAPRSLDDFHIIDGVGAALSALRAGDFRLIVVTNQPDIGNGLVAVEVVEAMHARLRRELPLDDIRCCPHTRNDGCDCRKPKPGMLRAAAREFDIDLERSAMIGDRWGDIRAGNAAGCALSILIGDGYGEAAEGARADFVAPDLNTAAGFVLATLR